MAGPILNNTSDRIIRQAMREAGLLEKGSNPTSEDYAEYLPRLNDLVNFYQTGGLKLWLNEYVTIPLVAGVGTYVFGPGGILTAHREMRVLEGYYTLPNGVSRPLIPLSWDTYYSLSNQTAEGAVNSYFANKQQLNLIVKLWLVPDATAAQGVANFVMQVPVTNQINLTDQMNFPTEWFIALYWGLADEICTGQPFEIVSRCKEKAFVYKTALEDWDVEDAPTNFTPDPQKGGYSSRFS